MGNTYVFNPKFRSFSWNLAGIAERQEELLLPIGVAGSAGRHPELSPDRKMVIYNNAGGMDLFSVKDSLNELFAE